MTKRKEFIRAKLVNRTNADCSSVEAKNNRWHYMLKFEKSIGWGWLLGQVKKAEAEVDTPLELWEIHPSGVMDFAIEVREVDRRKNIDNSQRGLSDFES
jgi:hypothetical protein